MRTTLNIPDPLIKDAKRRALEEGKILTGALLASRAIRHGATFVTADRGFGRFEGLACRYGF